MKASWTIVALSLGVALQGCAALTGVEPTDLSVIRRGTPQYEVEALLGEPVEVSETELGRAVVYRYNRNMDPLVPPSVFPHFMLMPYLWPFVEHEARQQKANLRVPLTVLYDDDRRITSAFDDYQIDTLRRAAQGDAEAHYELGKNALQTDDKWRWLCRAAHRGDRQAQFNLSVMYSKDYENFPNDRVQAYMWYSLAAKGCAGTPGYCPNDLGRRFLAKKMTQEQITMVDSLVAEWEPNPAECENEPSHSGP